MPTYRDRQDALETFVADGIRYFKADTPQTEQKDVAFEFNGKLWTPKDADTPQTEERSE